jgi:hypothetical protein
MSRGQRSRRRFRVSRASGLMIGRGIRRHRAGLRGALYPVDREENFPGETLAVRGGRSERPVADPPPKIATGVGGGTGSETIRRSETSRSTGPCNAQTAIPDSTMTVSSATRLLLGQGVPDGARSGLPAVRRRAISLLLTSRSDQARPSAVKSVGYCRAPGEVSRASHAPRFENLTR